MTLSDWLYRAVLSKSVLTLSRDYFRLRRPLERRLYELARKHCGRQHRWVISLPRLIDKCGSVLEPRFFKSQLRKVINDDDLPEYHIAISFDPQDKPDALDGAFESRRWASNERILVSFWPRGQNPPDTRTADE